MHSNQATALSASCTRVAIGRTRICVLCGLRGFFSIVEQKRLQIPASISATLQPMKRHRWLLPLAAVMIAVTLTPARAARTLDFDALTIADIGRAFDSGALTSEKLVQLCLARIQAYDRQGPSLRAVLTLNPKALDTARALDAERKAKGPRSPLHGIPVVLKDNYNTSDLPTTGGSLLLEGSVPPDDAFVVKKLRAAGAIVLAKVNMSEFASGPARSSLGGQSLNPHDLTRTPSGSSGGTGVAIAAAYAPLGMGTDTGGSIRGPSTSNGIVGLKPTHGLLSRSGIIPLSLSFDTGGPMARSVTDVAIALGIMTGVDPADAATTKSQGKFESDYTKYLKADALKGARIGIARDFLGADPDVDWVVDAVARRDAQGRRHHRRCALSEMAARRQGGVLQHDPAAGVHGADRGLPDDARSALPEDPGGDDRSRQPVQRRAGGRRRAESRPLDAVQARGRKRNPRRLSATRRSSEHGLPMVRAVVDGIVTSQKLDAIVYPTSSRRPD